MLCGGGLKKTQTTRTCFFPVRFDQKNILGEVYRQTKLPENFSGIVTFLVLKAWAASVLHPRTNCRIQCESKFDRLVLRSLPTGCVGQFLIRAPLLCTKGKRSGPASVHEGSTLPATFSFTAPALAQPPLLAPVRFVGCALRVRLRQHYSRMETHTAFEAFIVPPKSAEAFWKFWPSVAAFLDPGFFFFARVGLDQGILHVMIVVISAYTLAFVFIFNYFRLIWVMGNQTNTTDIHQRPGRGGGAVVVCPSAARVLPLVDVDVVSPRAGSAPPPPPPGKVVGPRQFVPQNKGPLALTYPYLSPTPTLTIVTIIKCPFWWMRSYLVLFSKEMRWEQRPFSFCPP